MASIGTYKAKDGRIHTRILFVDPADGKRRTVRLGRVNKDQVTTVKGMIERLVKAKATGTPDVVAAAWLDGLPDTSYAKLAKAHLVTARTPREPTAKTEPTPAPKPCLGQFLDDYIKARTDIKPQSLVVLGHTVRNLRDFFGADRALDTITEGDADRFKTYLMAEKLSAATVARRCGFAKQFFRAAVRHRLIPGSPFGDLKSCVKANKERQRFVTREHTAKLVEAAPDCQWRAIIALSRFAGLRCPSETLLLKWTDVDWDRGRITIRSPKTERYAGHESRQVPLFPEVRAALLELLEQTEEGGPNRIITRYPEDTPNLSVELSRIALRAGLSDLPKPFVNLRGSCETELTAKFPAHVTAAWLGHTPKIAEAHYLMVTPEHFERAIQAPADTDGAAHRTAQQTGETSRENSQTVGELVHANPVLRGETAVCETSQVLANEGLGQGRI
jgi:integrase